MTQSHSGHYFPPTTTKIQKSAIFRGLENHEQRIKKYPSRGQQQQQQQQQQKHM